MTFAGLGIPSAFISVADERRVTSLAGLDFLRRSLPSTAAPAPAAAAGIGSWAASGEMPRPSGPAYDAGLPLASLPGAALAVPECADRFGAGLVREGGGAPSVLAFGLRLGVGVAWLSPSAVECSSMGIMTSRLDDTRRVGVRSALPEVLRWRAPGVGVVSPCAAASPGTMSASEDAEPALPEAARPMGAWPVSSAGDAIDAAVSADAAGVVAVGTAAVGALSASAISYCLLARALDAAASALAAIAASTSFTRVGESKGSTARTCAGPHKKNRHRMDRTHRTGPVAQ